MHTVLVLEVCKMWEWRNYRGFHQGFRKPLVTKYQQEKYLDGFPEWTVYESVKVSPSCNGILGYGDDIHVRHLLSHQNYLNRWIAYVNRGNSPNHMSLDDAFMHSSWQCLHIYSADFGLALVNLSCCSLILPLGMIMFTFHYYILEDEP